MSLRADIHLAFDEISQSTQGLSERVLQTALTEAPARRRKARWLFRMRAPMGLVAALVLIALVAATLVANVLLRDWNTWSTAHPPQINQTEVKRLESKPWLLPLVAGSADCPVSVLTDTADTNAGEPSMHGQGPVYGPVSEFSKQVTTWGTWHWTYFRVDTKTSGTAGLLLIRARDLKTGETVRFAQSAEVTTYQAIPTGKLLGSDVTNSGETVHAYSEAVLDLSVAANSTKQWPKYTVLLGYSKGAKGCIGYQIDSPNFAEILVLDLTQVPVLYA